MLPLFELVINENLENELEVNYIAGVDKPAIQKNFYAFKEQQHRLSFAQVNEDERIVIGAAMVPDSPIPRKDDDGAEYFVFFSKETINTIAIKFFAKDFQKNFNIMHDPTQVMDGVVFFQSFIKDSTKGVQGMTGDYPDGTWFLGAKVYNDAVWAKIKSGEIKGWSVEGMFGFKKENTSDEVTLAKIKSLLSETFE